MYEHLPKQSSADAAPTGSSAASSRAVRTTDPARRTWLAPAVEVLPPLRDLTLQSPIGGDEGGFGFLDLPDPTRRLG
ncbi:MAG TPA: hypothetical protein VF188_14290 [Longimicrobiales bacterium]